MGGTAAFVQLPLDTGNTGKKVRTISRVVGADTVHEHFFIMSSARDYLGVYGYHSGKQVIQAAATNGTTTGFWWLINPIGTTIKVGIERLRYIHQQGTNLVTATIPRVALALITFTGTASGAAITPGKIASMYPAAQGSMRTASTGLTVTLGAILDATLPFVNTGTIAYTATMANFDDNVAISEMSDIQLAAGEGAVCYQPDAGTTSDTRILVADIFTAEWS
jgi:hypothetical protein